jgi:glycosyltransferase involved in cell wall biosynthesis
MTTVEKGLRNRRPGSVVFTFSLETFDDAVRREFCRPPDQTLLALAGDGRVDPLSMVDPWRSWPVDLLKLRPLQRRQKVDIESRSAWRLRPRRIRRGEPTETARLRETYRSYGEVIGRLLPAEHDGGATLVTFHPFVAAWARGPWIRKRVFIGRDDWASSPRERPWWDAYREAYREIDAECDFVFTVSQELASRISPDRAVVVPNGLDAQRWTRLRNEPSFLGQLPRPIGVYAGTIDARIDVELVAEAARSLQAIVLAGPHHDPDTVAMLQRVSGVHLLGELGQDELVALIQHCDVGLVPHRDTPLTRAMSPLKLYEYLGGGLPVVSTDLPPVRGVSSRVALCSERVDWADATAAAVALGRLEERDRLGAVTELAWRARLRPIVDAAVAT